MKMIMLLLSLVLITGTAFGKDHKDDKSKSAWLKKELNLTDEQMAKVSEIRKTLKGDISESKKSYMELRKTFKTAMKDPKSSNADLTAKFESFQKARDDFQRKRFNKMLKMREILTPEQMAKFIDLKEKMKNKVKGKKKK